MSKPTMEAWDCAMHMVRYLYGQRHRGIRYKSNGNAVPVCYYDSSARGDYVDSKCQYGHVVMLYGGPIIWSSKKHGHVGLSSSHNEYMALMHASVDIIWLRQLLTALRFKSMVSNPTLMLGDNDQATRLSREDIVTPGDLLLELQDLCQ